MSMDILEDLMVKRKCVKHCLRANCAAPEDIQLTGKVKVAKIYSNLLYKRENEPEMMPSKPWHQSGGTTRPA